MNEQNKRSYNTTEFDWDGDEDPGKDQGQIEQVESLIRTAIQATAPVGDRWLKPSIVDNDRARVQYNVPYALTDEQKSHMSELVGDIRTLTYNASGYHDHPVSHCLTEISEDLVVRGFGNTPFVSVWGNANRHRRMGHTGAKIVGSRVIPHDWFRNRGSEESVTDVDAFTEARGHMQYRLFLSTHALYYMTLEEVACWLGGNPDAEFHAVIHKHSKSAGYLNLGEIRYEVNSEGIVSQTNPLTGFKYEHRSLEPLFHVDSCRLFGGKVGLAWDINRLAGDNYHIKFVLCDATACTKVVDPYQLIKKDREVYVRGDVTVYRCLSYEWFVYHGPDKQTLLADVDLYDRLRRIIAGKERTPRAKQDLMAMCRRLANKNDIISIHQGFTHEVAPEIMTDYVNAAFYADVKHELEVALMYHRENKGAVDALNRYIMEGKCPVDATILGYVGRAVALPFHALGGLLRDQPFYISPDIATTQPYHAIHQVPPDPFKLKEREGYVPDMFPML